MALAMWTAGAGAALILLSAGAAQAATVTVTLGPSAENLTQYGQGPDGTGLGTFREGQGAAGFSGANALFTLSGVIVSASDPLFSVGTYEFETIYAGANAPQGGPNAPHGRTSASDPSIFNYTSLDPSTRIFLSLKLPNNQRVMTLFNGSAFLGSFNFTFAGTPTCTGLGALACTQTNVGLTPGSTISGPVNITATFDPATGFTPAPEPATWSMLIAGFGLIGLGLRRRRTQAALISNLETAA